MQRLRQFLTSNTGINTVLAVFVLPCIAGFVYALDLEEEMRWIGMTLAEISPITVGSYVFYGGIAAGVAIWWYSKYVQRNHDRKYLTLGNIVGFAAFYVVSAIICSRLVGNDTLSLAVLHPLYRLYDATSGHVTVTLCLVGIAVAGWLVHKITMMSRSRRTRKSVQ